MDLRVTCTSEPGVFLVSEGDTVVASVNAGRVMAGKELAYAMAAAPDLLEACESMIPANVCLTNRNVRDDMVVPLEATMGDLRKIAAAIARAKGGAA